MNEPPDRPSRHRVHEASVLLREILTLTRDVERNLGRELGVNPTDLEAMQHLIEAGPLSPSTLAERLGITTAAATIAIDRLVKLGHVSRTPHPTDRRRLLIVPREASVRQAMTSLMPMIVEIDNLMDSYSEGEQNAITDYLARTAAILTRQIEPGQPGVQPD